MNSNQVSSSRVNSFLKATTYASYNQHLSKQYILRAQRLFY